MARERDIWFARECGREIIRRTDRRARQRQIKKVIRGGGEREREIKGE